MFKVQGSKGYGMRWESLMDGGMMKRKFTASLWREGEWIVAQCLEVDVASQGHTEEEAMANLSEALTLHFTPPCATITPDIRPLEVDLYLA